jgi:acetyl esterase/lipase
LIESYEYLNSKINIEELTVVGDSSGATIAINTAQLLKDVGLPQPKELVLLSPWLDLSLANPQIDVVNLPDPIFDVTVLQKLGREYSKDVLPNDSLVSPIYQDLRRIAPITVFIGTRDIMLADCRKLKNLSASLPTVFTYREFEGMIHDWMYFDFPEGKTARNMIFDHIKHEPSEFELVMQENEFGW